MEKLEKILEQVADNKDIKNYEIHIDKDALNGDGFLSDNYTGNVKNKDTGETINIYIKKMPSNPGPYGNSAYNNENHFYSKIWPELNKFQNEKRVKNPFRNITEFYGCGNDPGEQYLCLDNLKLKKFDILDKSLTIDKNILKIIFEKYGQFHALTFAFKDQNIEKYNELVSPLRDVYIEFEEDSSNRFMLGLEYSFKAAYGGLIERAPEQVEKVGKYANNIAKYYSDIKVYDGTHSSLVHGDCWSNNMLFKQKENGEIEDVKFIDFQLCRDSTPIHDLSYFFYSGASKEDFDNLDMYLETYHKSFSAFAKELGSDPEQLLPLDSLKSEWKKHSLLGIFMGILLWQIKLIHKDKIKNMTSGNDEESFMANVRAVLTGDTFKKNTSDILLHAISYGIL